MDTMDRKKETKFKRLFIFISPNRSLWRMSRCVKVKGALHHTPCPWVEAQGVGISSLSVTGHWTHLHIVTFAGWSQHGESRPDQCHRGHAHTRRRSLRGDFLPCWAGLGWAGQHCDVDYHQLWPWWIVGAPPRQSGCIMYHACTGAPASTITATTGASVQRHVPQHFNIYLIHIKWNTLFCHKMFLDSNLVAWFSLLRSRENQLT